MNKNENGFLFSLETTFALLVFVFAILTMFQPTEISSKEIVAVQQANDLLKIWSIEYPSIIEAIEDCEKMFGNKFQLKIDGTKVSNNTENFGDFKNIISSGGILLDDNLVERKFEILVYFD